MFHRDHDLFDTGDEVHCTAHAFDHFAWDHPVGDVSFLGDLHGAQDAHVDVSASDHGEGLGRCERSRAGAGGDGLFACVDQIGVDVFFGREGSDPEESVLRLKPDIHPVGDVIGDECRHPDPEVDNVAVLQLLSCPFGDVFAG